MPSLASEGGVKVEGEIIQLHMSKKGWTEHQEGRLACKRCAKVSRFSTTGIFKIKMTFFIK